MARKSAFMQKVETVAIRERKREAKFELPDHELVREASRERADKVRALVSLYVHERNYVKYLVIAHGREEAARMIDGRATLLNNLR